MVMKPYTKKDFRLYYPRIQLCILCTRKGSTWNGHSLDVNNPKVDMKRDCFAPDVDKPFQVIPQKDVGKMTRFGYDVMKTCFTVNFPDDAMICVDTNTNITAIGGEESMKITSDKIIISNPVQIFSNEQFALSVMEHWGSLFDEVPDDMIDYQMMLNCVSSCGMQLKNIITCARFTELSPEQKQTIMTAAVTNDGYCAIYVPDKFRTKQLQLAAAKSKPHSIMYFSDADKDVVRAALERDGSAIEAARLHEKYRNLSEEFQQLACSTYGFALRDLPDASSECRRLALENEPWSIQFIKNPEVNECIISVESSGNVIECINIKPMPKSVKLTAVRQNSNVLKLIGEQTFDVCVAACKKFPEALGHIRVKALQNKVSKYMADLEAQANGNGTKKKSVQEEVEEKQSTYAPSSKPKSQSKTQKRVFDRKKERKDRNK